MKLLQIAMLACVISMSCGNAFATTDEASPRWPPDVVAALVEVAQEIPEFGLDRNDFPFDALDAALDGGDRAMIDRRADELVAELARGLATGIVPPSERRNWRIVGESLADSSIDIAIGEIISGEEPLAVLRRFEPQHPEYNALKAALKTAKKEKTRRRIAANLERWRWMPRNPGEDYVLVNSAAFELTYFARGFPIARHRVIVGAAKTPTRQFSAEITGVVLNPTWYVPSSIVAESVGALMAEQPRRAEQLGFYVGDDGGVRQRPGPANALGLMKFIMPNPFSIFLHDTPNRTLFQRTERALSHGCVRVEDAMGLAAAVLGQEWDHDTLAALIDRGVTTTIDLLEPLPIYVTYFTAAVDEAGELAYYPDIYGLDRSIFNIRQDKRAETAHDEISCLAA